MKFDYYCHEGAWHPWSFCLHHHCRWKAIGCDDGRNHVDGLWIPTMWGWELKPGTPGWVRMNDPERARSGRSTPLYRAIVWSTLLNNKRITKYPYINHSLTNMTLKPGQNVSPWIQNVSKCSPWIQIGVLKCLLLAHQQPQAGKKTVWPVESHWLYIIQSIYSKSPIKLTFHAYLGGLFHTKKDSLVKKIVQGSNCSCLDPVFYQCI